MKQPLAEMETVIEELADSTRLRILGLLLTGEVCVCHINAALKIPQPKASRHLAYLRRAKLVAARREGTWMHYRLAALSDDALRMVREAVTEALWRQPAVQKDLAQLSRLTGCCVPASDRKSTR